MASISSKKDHFLYKMLDLDEQLENIYLLLIEIYLDFSGDNDNDKYDDDKVKPRVRFSNNSALGTIRTNNNPLFAMLKSKKNYSRMNSIESIKFDSNELKDMSSNSLVGKKEYALLFKEKQSLIEDNLALEQKCYTLEANMKLIKEKDTALNLENEELTRELQMIKLQNQDYYEEKEKYKKIEVKLSLLRDVVLSKDNYIQEIKDDLSKKTKDFNEEMVNLNQKLIDNNIKIKELLLEVESKEKLKNKIKELSTFKDNQYDYDNLKTEIKVKKRENEQILKTREKDFEYIEKILKENMIEKNKVFQLEMKVAKLEAECEHLKQEIGNLDISLQDKKVNIYILNTKLILFY